LGGFAGHPFGHHRRNVDHMLAIVEHEGDLLVADKGQETAQRIRVAPPERPRDRRGYKLGIGQRGETDKKTPPLKPSNGVWATDMATVVFPMPPGPTMLTNRYIIN
jgi:hypothetical protein